MFTLVVKVKGREFKKSFSNEAVTIGRRSGNDIQLADSSVSKEHARIEARRKGHVLIDLDSANGTLVNGSPVSKQRLKHGDVITIGAAELVFQERQAGDLESEIESAADAMEHGVGYETMLARITKDQKDKDLAAIRGMATEEDTASLEKTFIELGWSEAEARRLAEESKGRPVEEINDALVEEIDRPKVTEVALRSEIMLPDVDSGFLVRYRGKDYLVVEAKDKGTHWEYRLKRC